MGYSRWLLADLQVHSPADRQQKYGDVGGPEPNEQFARRLLQAHKDAGVEILAVTDHNTVAWWPVLNELAPEFGLYVFPGMEINVNKCHLLAIWERNDQGLLLAKQFLANCFDPGVDPLEKNRTPRPVEGSFLKVAEEAVRTRGLVFAPHATMKRIGLFAKDVCNTSAQVAKSGLVSGFDVIGDRGLDVLSNPKGEFGDRVPPWFSSGDTRTLDDVGKRACYLKTGPEPTLESLRQAFLMSETRVRLRGEMRSRWKQAKHVKFLDAPQPSCERIVSIEVAGGFHDGLNIDFGPGLNAVIGGKGTGKSTLIEMLRYCLEAPESIAAKAATRDGRTNLDANFSSNAEATIRYQSASGDEYDVVRAGGGNSARLFRDGAQLDFEPRRRIRVRVFGQRELAELPNRADALAEFVLSRKAKEFDQAEQRVDTALGVARKIAEELDELDTELIDFKETQEELGDLTERLQQIVKSGATDLADESEALQQADTALNELFEWPAEVIEQAQELESQEVPELPKHPLLPAGIKSTRRDGLESIRKAAKGLVKAVESLARELDGHEAEWEKVRDARREEIARLLADAGLEDPAELSQLQTRKAELERRLTNSKGKQKRRAALLPKRTSAIDNLDKARRERSRLIKSAVDDMNDRTGRRVRIALDPLANLDPLFEFIADEITERKLTSAQTSRLKGRTGQELAAAVFSKEPDALSGLGLTSNLEEKLGEASGECLRRLEEVDRPDLIRIEVNLAEKGPERWTDVQDASPGQAATAMLELALIASDEPLIIDQPEDDLDNRFIYDEVVAKVAEVASERQVIVATHNANIPVLGDAELVLALDATTDRGEVLVCGGLDEENVADMARRILEGGKAAFEERSRRYATKSPST
jgi:ABC-type lipoprotein export system ATPase subunit